MSDEQFDFEDEIDGGKHGPEWLEAVADRVDEMVADPAVKKRFRQMIGEWIAEHDAHELKTEAGEARYIQPNPVKMIVRRPTLAAKYARLAAIHDALCEDVELIGPDVTHEGLKDAEVSEEIALLSWIALHITVGEVQEKDRSRIEAMLETFHSADRPASEGKADDPFGVTSDDAMLGPAKIAELAGVPAEPLRTRLNRWRKKNGEGWIENAERGGQDAQYLYRVGAVRHIIDGMRATTSRPPHKNG